jgi:hypothetical protein
MGSPPLLPLSPLTCLKWLVQSTASSDTPSDLEFRDLREVDRFLASKGIVPSPGFGAEVSTSSVGTQDLEDALDISGRLRRVADVLHSTSQVGGAGRWGHPCGVQADRAVQGGRWGLQPHAPTYSTCTAPTTRPPPPPPSVAGVAPSHRSRAPPPPQGASTRRGRTIPAAPAAVAPRAAGGWEPVAGSVVPPPAVVELQRRPFPLRPFWAGLAAPGAATPCSNLGWSGSGWRGRPHRQPWAGWALAQGGTKGPGAPVGAGPLAQRGAGTGRGAPVVAVVAVAVAPGNRLPLALALLQTMGPDSMEGWAQG